MNLTVDASVAVKWFVAEPLHDDARRLLSHRLSLHAPDLLLAEFANTVWKKARKGEIDDPQPYYDELVRLPDIDRGATPPAGMHGRSNAAGPFATGC